MVTEKIYITASISAAGIHMLHDKNFQVEIGEQDSTSLLNKINEHATDARALVSLLSDQIDKEVINSIPNLKIIANYAVGYNNIDLSVAKKRGIIVTNTPDVLTAATADLTWALILSVSKRIPESERFMRDRKFTGWQPKLFLGGDVTGKTLGIIGSGRIGQAVAKRAKGFDMQILYHTRSQNNTFEKETSAAFVSLETLLQKSDFISIHCPLTEDTYHLLHSENMKKIKQGAYLINTARGPVIDERAMIEALHNGTLAGAGLDVYEFEPQLSEELLNMKQVVLLPHIGSATVETRNEMSRICARNIIAVLENKPALTPVF